MPTLTLGNNNNYPSVALKSDKTINYSDSDCTMYRKTIDNNSHRMDETAILLEDGERMSYRDLIVEADLIADIMTSKGIRKGDIIPTAVVSPSPQLIALWFACSKIGVALMILRPNTKEETFNYIVSNMDVPVMFCSPGEYKWYGDMEAISQISEGILFPDYVSFGKDREIVSKINETSNFIRWGDFLKTPVTEKAEEVNGGYFPMAVCNTTGSTGFPKGIVLENSSYVAFSEILPATVFDWKPGEVILGPPFVIMASAVSMNLLVPIIMGVTILLINPANNNPSHLFSMIEKYKIINICVPKSAWLMSIGFLDNADRQFDLSSLRTPFTCGEAITQKEYELINDSLQRHGFGGNLINAYGMSEANSLLSCPKNRSEKCSSAGFASPGVDIAIFDPDTGKELPFGEVGALYYKSPNVMREYLYNPKATKEFFQRDNKGIRWGYSGDLAKISPDGEIFVLGRVVERFTDKTGNSVHPYMVEEILNRDDNILRVKMITTEYNGEAVTSVHVLLRQQPEDKAAYCHHIYDMLKSGKLPVLPKLIKIRDDFPMNAGGKLDMLKMASETDGFEVF